MSNTVRDMARKLEEVKLAAYRPRIVSDVKDLVDKFRAVFDWDIPDVDQTLADRLIIAEIRKALDDIERELSANPTRQV